MATTAEFGTWKSPITSAIATESTVTFQELHVDRANNEDKRGTVYWSELRFYEDGRYAVCSIASNEDKVTTWTPRDYNSRTRVHEYGGGSFSVYDGQIIFTNFKDQCLHVQKSASDQPEALTDESTGCRHADREYNAKYGLLYAVCEDHSLVEAKKAKEASNYIIAFNLVSKQQIKLISGCDFYSSPKVSPDGQHIAWVEWNHPNMPWDSTEIWRARLNASGTAIVDGSKQKVAGGDNISVMMPRWTPDNRLVYIGDQSEWWNLYCISASGEHDNLHAVSEEVGGPHWVFADYRYDIDPSGSGNIVTTFSGKLGVLNMNSKEYQVLETGFTTHTFVQYASDGNIYCVGGSPQRFHCVLRINPENGKVDVLKESRKSDIDVGYISVPEEVSWTTGNNETAHGYYYPPQNKDFTGPADSKPPLVLKCHQGPTWQCYTNVNVEYQYFTSRGFSILDVNYRGSTGYGKTYRHRQRKNWGIVDVEDCSTGALYLAKVGKADSNRLCIDGQSAGGYTTLACLAFSNVFKAGASHFGVADCAILAAETHKFESQYLNSLIAPYSEENIPIFDARSPIKHCDKVTAALALFQGTEDEIVPPNQAKMMYKAVKEKGLPTCLVLFEGEQHGFRKAENVQKALDGEFYFFSKVFGFKAANLSVEMEIDNL